MTLHELLTALSPSLHPSRVKDLKTAVRYLAHALGAADPTQCREADYRLPWIELKARLDHLLTNRQASPHTIRNVHNNLSYLFRQAQAAGLLTIPITRRPLQRRQDIERVHRASRTSGRIRAEIYGFDLKSSFFNKIQLKKSDNKPRTVRWL
jgi:hypothetical protein